MVHLQTPISFNFLITSAWLLLELMNNLCISLWLLRIMVMNVSKNLRFNLCIGIMYVEQNMYSVDSDVLQTILLQQNMNEDGHY